MKLDKRTVARQQLDAAIRLLFAGDQPVPAHVLAWTSVDVLRGVAEHRGVETFRAVVADHIRPERLDEWRQAERAFYTFSKHADRDPEAELDNFSEELTCVVLLAGLTDYRSLYGVLTLPMALFAAWTSWYWPDWYQDHVKNLLAPHFADLGDPRAHSLHGSLRRFADTLAAVDKDPSLRAAYAASNVEF